MAVTWTPDEIEARIRKAAMRGVVRATEAVRAEAISLILSTSKSGRTYIRGGRSHIASAPGEPPASDTGRLVNGISTVYDLPNLTGKINMSVAYGFFLEFGTQKMEARPFLRPAFANKRQVIESAIQDEIIRELKK